MLVLRVKAHAPFDHGSHGGTYYLPCDQLNTASRYCILRCNIRNDVLLINQVRTVVLWSLEREPVAFLFRACHWVRKKRARNKCLAVAVAAVDITLAPASEVKGR